jgi:hypothetical protein
MAGDGRVGGAGMFDARISLATALYSQPGTYALLLGSGASTGAGVLTGWGVVKALVAQAAAASDGQSTTELDAEEWWGEHGDGQPLGYSGLLACLASTPAARRALLAGFFEPTPEEREQGLKVPGPAHEAIATLVQRGVIRVIVTTNFDRLIEQALEAKGISPQVISSAGAIEGMEPLVHARCTVIKLHGDYTRIDQLNTVEELSEYGEATKALLDRVLDEYGLIINGWSADWDTALVAAIEGTRSRRYPLFWSVYGPLGEAATRLVAQHRAHVIEGAAADEFFPGLVSRLDALEGLSNSPLSTAMSIGRLKRALPDPAKYIELRDLLDREISDIRSFLAARPQMPPAIDGQTLQDEHDQIRARCDTLLHLLAQGVYLDRYRQHTDLWVWAMEQLMRARPSVNGTFNEVWVALNHYPAALALKAASLAAVAIHHDDVMLRLHREPTWRDQFGERRETAAVDALFDYSVLDHNAINSFPRWGSKWLYPHSHLFKAELVPVILPLVGDQDSYTQLYNRTEYRTALIQRLSSKRGHSMPGEFMGDWQWNQDGLIWEADFRQHADREAWGWPSVQDGEKDPFSDKLTEMVAGLQSQRRI